LYRAMFKYACRWSGVLVLFLGLVAPPLTHGSSRAAGEVLREIRVFLQQGKLAEAEKRLGAGLKEFPHEAGLYDLRGVVAAEKGDYRGAEEAFQKAGIGAPGDDPAEAAARVQRIYEAGRRLMPHPSPSWSTALRERFFAALAEDFHTPAALAAVFEWVREANRAPGPVGEVDLREMLAVLALDNLLRPVTADVPPEVQELSNARESARSARDFSRADRLREQLRELGWEVRDGPEGPELLSLR